MFKAFGSVFSIVVLLLPTFLYPIRATACPVEPPSTLLQLYRASDTIYVGRFDKVEDHEIIENTDELTVVNIKRHFDISSTLKGETRKLLVLDDTDYRYKNSAGAEQHEVSEEPEEENDDTELMFGTRSLKAGDLVLIFLNTGEEGKTAELAHYRDGIRKMNAERLSSYEARIKELNAIFSRAKVDDAAIVDWLIRCVKDPATRWEGAFEFQQSFEELEWRLEQEKEEAAKAEESETAEAAVPENEDQTVAEESEGAEEAEAEDIDRSVYARLLTDPQKQELMNVVLDRRPASDEEGESVLTAGDKSLIEVVAEWGDHRFARFLLEAMRGGDNYLVQNLMSIAAKILSDGELGRISERYSNVYYQDEDAIVGAGEENSEVDEEAREESETSEAATEQMPLEKDTTEVTAVTANEQRSEVEKQTYRQLRAELLAKFLDRGSVVIELAEKEKVESASP